MKGTEKQIAWAEDIKRKMIAATEAELEKTEWALIKKRLQVNTIDEAVKAVVDKTGAPLEGVKAEAEKYYLKYREVQEKLEEIKAQDNANWFIDRREVHLNFSGNIGRLI